MVPSIGIGYEEFKGTRIRKGILHGIKVRKRNIFNLNIGSLGVYWLHWV